MINLGDRAVGSTISFLFNTHKADGTPITLAGTPVISVYKNSTTQSTSGITLTVDYDSRTGMHQVIIDLSADGTFYATDNDFNVVVTTGTVDSISVVGAVVGKFSIGRQNISHAASTAWASGAITAASIAADAIGSSEFAQAAADKVWSSAARTLTAFSTSLALSVWDVLTANIATASSFGKKLVDWLAGTDTSTPTTNVTKVGGTVQTAGDLITEIVEAQAETLAVVSSIVLLSDMLDETVYTDGAVWIDTVNGAAGTVNYVNGTALNPSSNMTDAKIIADNLGINTFKIVNGNPQLVASMAAGYNFIGVNMPILRLNSQNIGGCYFENLYINGSSSALSATARYSRCVFNNNAMSLCATTDCYFEGSMDLITTGAYEFIDSNSVLTLAPFTLNFGAAVGASTVLFTGFSGRLKIQNMHAGDKLDVNGDGTVEFEASCTSGTAAVSGHIEITDNSAGTVVTDNTGTSDGGLTAQETRDAMKLAPTAGAPATGSIDEHLDTLIVDVANVDSLVLTVQSQCTIIDGKVDVIDTNVDDIETLLGTVNGNVNDIESKVDIIDTNVDDVETLLGTVNGNVNDTETKVDAIGIALNTVDGNVDDIETLLGTVNGNVNDIEADIADIDARIPATLVSGRMNSNVDSIKDDEDTPTLLNKAIVATEVGEVGAGTHTTTYLDITTLVGLTVDAVKHRVINFTSGDNKGRSAPIIGYVSVSGAITMDSNYPLPATPVNGDTFTVT